MEQNTRMQAAVQALYELAGIERPQCGMLVREEGSAGANLKSKGI